VGAAFAGVDRVDVRVEFLVVLGRILQRDLEFELVLGIFFGDIDGFGWMTSMPSLRNFTNSESPPA